MGGAADRTAGGQHRAHGGRRPGGRADGGKASGRTCWCAQRMRRTLPLGRDVGCAAARRSPSQAATARRPLQRLGHDVSAAAGRSMAGARRPPRLSRRVGPRAPAGCAARRPLLPLGRDARRRRPPSPRAPALPARGLRAPSGVAPAERRFPSVRPIPRLPRRAPRAFESERERACVPSRPLGQRSCGCSEAHPTRCSSRVYTHTCAPTTVGGATADFPMPQVRYGAWAFSQERREATARRFK